MSFAVIIFVGLLAVLYITRDPERKP